MSDTVPVPPEAASALVGDKRWELIQRVASSVAFKKSPRLRQFLLFVGERSVSGHTADISEYEIGWKVFERGPNYNPMDDSIVRSAARQLRAKVKEYFETEGIGEVLIVEIPKGGYVPVFNEREHLAAPLIHADPPPSAVDDHLQVDLRRWKILAATLAAGLVVFAAVALWKTSIAAPFAPRRGETIVSTVLSKDQPTTVVLGDFGMAYVSAATKHPLTAAEYANRNYPSIVPGKTLDPPFQQIWGGLLGGQITSIHEVNIAAAILRLSVKEQKETIVRQARQLSAQDFRAGNMIVIASPISSPWIHLLEDKLNFRYKIRYEQTFAGEPEFENLHPQPGEKSSYPVDSTPGFGTSYAILARVPNLSGTGKILIIYGFRASGAQAVGEYATDPRAGEELARVFGVSHVSDLPDFEVLLSNDSVASTPFHVQIVAHRLADGRLP